ncbi:MAG: class I SAM-dependent methyltransferase [Verrucomicrobia bacterium]|nr:class I SAM-dependent methyltransferase [Verrucomicrobiota bacterium]
MGATTAINPGAFRARRTSARKLVSIVAKHLRHQRPVEGVRRSLIELANFFSDRLPASTARFECPCCGRRAFAFHHLRRAKTAWNSACPGCDSRSRHRGLALLLPELLDARRRPEPTRVLHVAPEPILMPLFRRSDVSYESCDYFLEDVTHQHQDLQALTLPSASYEFVLCNHVIEHVERDDLAVAEIARVLVPGGQAVITIPGDWRRRENVDLPDRPNGHFRDYGSGVTEMFARSFAQVETMPLARYDRTPEGLRRGIRADDVAFLCRKA